MKLQDETIADRHEKDPLIVISEEACKPERRTFKTRPLSDDNAEDTDLVEQDDDEQNVSITTTDLGNIMQYSEDDEEHLESHLIGRFDVRHTNQGPVCLLLDREAMVKAVMRRDKDFSPENKKDKRTTTFSCWVLKHPLAVDEMEAKDLQEATHVPSNFTVSSWGANEIVVKDNLSHDNIAKCEISKHVLEWSVGAHVDVGFIAQIQFANYILHHPPQVDELVELSKAAEWKLVGTAEAGVAYGEAALAGHEKVKAATAATGAVRHSNVSQAKHAKSKSKKGNPLKRLKPVTAIYHHTNRVRSFAHRVTPGK